MSPSTLVPVERVALYPGSFDGVTYGHLDLIERGRKLFDRLIVAVAHNSRKVPWFTPEERSAQLQECCASYCNVEIATLEGLTVEFAARQRAQFILRGLRAVSDFEFEFQLAIMNFKLMPTVETIFLAPAPEYVFLSSSMVKEVYTLGGDVSPFVPPAVLKAFENRARRGA